MLSFVLGIDVAKLSFYTAVLNGASVPDSPRAQPRFVQEKFDNNPAGFKKLFRWLKKLGVAPNELHACMEATGGYHEQLALYLHGQGCTVSVVNPAQLSSYAQSQLLRTKTDRMDACVIARYCQKENPAPWQPPALHLRQLQSLARHLASLIQDRASVNNQLQAPLLSAEVQTSLKRYHTFLSEEIKQVEQQIREHINCHPDLKGQVELLQSIPGIGERTAHALLAELGDVSRFNKARQASAYAGLVPKFWDSGTSVHKKPTLSKRGNAALRTLLYFPALTAMRYNPNIKPLVLRLKEKNKPNSLIIAAAMRKLIQLAAAVLISGRPFDPAYLQPNG